MRLVMILVASVGGLAAANPTLAYDKFIPLGTGYSTDVATVPAFDSTRGRINQEADIIETEIYRANEADIRQDSHINRFFSDPEVSGADQSIDY